MKTVASSAADLLIWIAFVSGAAKVAGHESDAEPALGAFLGCWHAIESDIPPEPATNLAAVALAIAGFRIDPAEWGCAYTVVGLFPSS